MKRSHAKNGLGLLIFALVGLSALSSAFYVFNTLISPAEMGAHSSGVFVYSGEHVPVDWDKGRQRSAGLKFRLTRDSPLALGGARIFYRGLAEDANFVLDVMLPDLDPNAFYPYKLKIADARDGFQLVDHNFKLIRAHRHYIQMYLLE